MRVDGDFEGVFTANEGRLFYVGHVRFVVDPRAGVLECLPVPYDGEAEDVEA